MQNYLAQNVSSAEVEKCWSRLVLNLFFHYCPPKEFLSFFVLNIIATLFIYLLFIYFLAVLGLRFVRGLSLVAASGGHSSSRCAGLSLSRPLPWRGTGSRRAGSVVVAHGPSCSVACGMWDLPRPGLEPVSPALAGRFSTTAPPGKPFPKH